MSLFSRTRREPSVISRADRARPVGAEAAGLPEPVLEEFPESARIRLPMAPGNRSLNLSNAAAIVVYEALRQLGRCT